MSDPGNRGGAALIRAAPGIRALTRLRRESPLVAPLPVVEGVRVQSALGRGRSRPLVIEGADGNRYVVKLRASPKTARRLIAEVIAGQIAKAIGIRQPPMALIQIDREIEATELLDEKEEELRASEGLVFGSLEITGAASMRRTIDPTISPDTAADIVWFDAFVINADRKWRNPNILAKKNGYWVIDNDSAFHLHHKWAEPERRKKYQFSPISGTTWWSTTEHVLLPWASSIAAAGERLAAIVDDAVIEAAVASVPKEWFDEGFPDGSTMEPAEAYVEFLRTRLSLRADFEALADEARHHGYCRERA